MKLFISWSGQLSREVGEILRKYLPLMLQDLSVFMSKNDLESGSRWSLELAKELDESQFGVICLTPDNLNSSWILFEAGALTKHLEGGACGLLLNGLSPVDITGPLSQFQHRVFVKSEFFALVKDLNVKLNNSLGESQLNLVFEKWWSDLEKEYKSAIKRVDDSHPVVSRRDQQEVLEEILVRVRSIGQSLDFNNYRSGRGDDIGGILYESLNALTQSTLQLIFDIAEYDADTPIVLSDLEQRYSIDDIKTLAERALINIKDGNVSIHDLVRTYLRARSDKLRAKFLVGRAIPK